MSNLAQILADTAAQHGDRPALKLDDSTFDYNTLLDASQRATAMLKSKGIGPGDRVGLVLPNVPHYAVLFYGAAAAGATVVPMNPLLKAREIHYFLENSECSIVFPWEDMAEETGKAADDYGIESISVEATGFLDMIGQFEPDTEIVERADDDNLVLLYTSGTTGQPKGAELSHANMLTNAETSADTLAQLEPEDVVMGCLPLFHCFGLTCGLNAAVKVGALMTMLPRFDGSKALEIVQRDKVTVFEGVPTMYSGMLNADDADSYDVSSLRSCMSGGSPMPVEVMNQFEEKFDCMVLEGYGLSETSPVASFNHPGEKRKPGSIGTPVRGVEMKLLDDDANEVAQGERGEIAIKGENVMKGYWNKPEETKETFTEDGWFLTGDVAEKDEDGYFFIVDRKKDMILRGGYNVYPREVEEVLYEHPSVAECAVIGVPHDEMGEEVCAAVVLKKGESATSEELQQHAKDGVAAYKYPRHVWIVDGELPKGPTGKILKREIETPDDVEVNA